MANIIREIFFLITYHKKFDKTLEKLELKERNPETGSDYLRLFSSFAWLLYVHAKNSLLKKSLDIIENTCLLAHAISFMIIYAWDYLLPGVLLKGLTAERRLAEKSSLKELSLAVKEWVLELFKIRNM